MKVPRESERSPWRWVFAVVILAAFGVWAVRARSGAGLDPDRLWNEAKDEFQAGRLDRVEAALSRLAVLRRPTPLDWILKAQVTMARGRDREAIDDLSKVPDSHPMAAQSRLLAGQAELRNKRAARAEKRLIEAATLDPTLIQAHRELIYLYGMQLRRPELNREFQTLSKLTPLTFENVWHWCLTRNLTWEPTELVDILREWVAADPEDRSSRLALADACRRVASWSEADKALSTLPENDPDALAVRARIAFDRGDGEAAEKLLANGPADHPEIARMRGRLALSHRDGPSAVQYFRAAYALEPDSRDNVSGLGQALTMAGKPTEAAPFLASARDYDALGTLVQRASASHVRKDPALMRALGFACETVHRDPEALAWFGLAIQANPLDAEAQKAVYRLKQKISTDKPARSPG